jgi:hypothetical protein
MSVRAQHPNCGWDIQSQETQDCHTVAKPAMPPPTTTIRNVLVDACVLTVSLAYLDGHA